MKHGSWVLGLALLVGCVRPIDRGDAEPPPADAGPLGDAGPLITLAR